MILRLCAVGAAIVWCALIYVETRQVVDIAPTQSPADMRQSLFDIAEQTAKKYSIVGGYVGLLDGSNIVGRAIGYADLVQRQAVDENSAFNVGSVSKPIAAWGVLALAQDGDIDLDAPVSRYLRKWRLPDSEFDLDQVTIRRLLRHTAGTNIYGYAGYESLDGPITQPLRPVKYAPASLAEASNSQYPIRIIHEPGGARRYSGGGFAILQMLIEDVSGQSFTDYMDERILTPLGMHNSGFAPQELSTVTKAYNIQQQPLPDMAFLALALLVFMCPVEIWGRFYKPKQMVSRLHFLQKQRQ